MACSKRLRHRLETLVTVFTNGELDCDCEGSLHKDAAWWLARLACAYRGRTIGEFLSENAWCVKPEPPEETKETPEPTEGFPLGDQKGAP